MSQSAVNEQGRALIGMKANLGPDFVSSYAAEGVVKIGRFVSLGTDKEEQVLVPALAADITSLLAKRGIALQSHARENAQDGLDAQYEDKATVSVMEKGMVYVEVEEAVTPASDVFVRFANGTLGGNEKGIFRTDADTASAAALANARFRSASESIDGKLVALLELL